MCATIDPNSFHGILTSGASGYSITKTTFLIDNNKTWFCIFVCFCSLGIPQKGAIVSRTVRIIFDIYFDHLLLFYIVFQWAFGILLWECYTCGGIPYAAVQNSKLLEYLVDQNKRLRMPSRLQEEEAEFL